jgi:hypothetical protein
MTTTSNRKIALVNGTRGSRKQASGSTWEERSRAAAEELEQMSDIHFAQLDGSRRSFCSGRSPPNCFRGRKAGRAGEQRRDRLCPRITFPSPVDEIPENIRPVYETTVFAVIRVTNAFMLAPAIRRKPVQR